METSAKHQGEFDNLNSTELTLGLPGVHQGGDEQPKMPTRKRAMDRELNRSETTKPSLEVTEPMAKVQVVGWPPVRSYRKNNMKVRKIEGDAINGVFVKVSMDGAPYLRKIDLMMYKSYGELQGTLENMFKCFSLGEAAGSDYAITYEDKDGDWMLVGDVPLGMFISSCKRLRIMRGSEARGLGSASN